MAICVVPRNLPGFSQRGRRLTAVVLSELGQDANFKSADGNDYHVVAQQNSPIRPCRLARGVPIACANSAIALHFNVVRCLRDEPTRRGLPESPLTKNPDVGDKAQPRRFAEVILIPRRSADWCMHEVLPIAAGCR